MRRGLLLDFTHTADDRRALSAVLLALVDVAAESKEYKPPDGWFCGRSVLYDPSSSSSSSLSSLLSLSSSPSSSASSSSSSSPLSSPSSSSPPPPSSASSLSSSTSSSSSPSSPPQIVPGGWFKFFRKNTKRRPNNNLRFGYENKIVNEEFSLLWVPHYPGRHYASKCLEIEAVWKRVKKLHEDKFVHFDLHWGNIVVDDGSVTLLDFDLGGEEGEESVLTLDHLNEKIDGVFRDGAIYHGCTVQLKQQHDVCMVRQLLLQCPTQNCRRWTFLTDKCKNEKPKTMDEMLQWLKDCPQDCECERERGEERKGGFRSGTGSPPKKGK